MFCVERKFVQQTCSSLHFFTTTLQESVGVQKIGLRPFLTKIVPLGLCSAGTMALGNTVYLYLDVAMVEMLKSCCPVFVFLVAVSLKLERFSWLRAVSTCVLPSAHSRFC